MFYYNWACPGHTEITSKLIRNYDLPYRLRNDIASMECR